MSCVLFFFLIVFLQTFFNMYSIKHSTISARLELVMKFALPKQRGTPKPHACSPSNNFV